MLKTVFSKALLSITIVLLFSNAVRAEASGPVVEVATSLGNFQMQLYPDKAPKTVANFLRYVEQGFYSDTIFHRVINRFVIQGGGFTADMQRKETFDPIENEDGNGLYNDRWMVAMARTMEPDSATSQFYINLKTNSGLNKRGKRRGYAVFAEVTEGRDVVREISLQETGQRAGMGDVPLEPVTILSVTLLADKNAP